MSFHFEFNFKFIPLRRYTACVQKNLIGCCLLRGDSTRLKFSKVISLSFTLIWDWSLSSCLKCIGMTKDERYLGIQFFLPLKKHLHSSSFRHSFVISKCLEWQEMKITMERYHSSVILLTSTSFRHSRMMMEWPNEGKWRDIFEPRQNPWFWNSPHSTVIPSF